MVKSNTCETGESRNEKDEKIWNLRHEIIVDLPGHIHKIIMMIECIRKDEELIHDKVVQYQLKHISDYLLKTTKEMTSLTNLENGLDGELYRIFGMRVFPGG